MSAQTLPHSDAARLPQERQSVACVSIHTPGPVQTASPSRVASGQSYRRRQDRFAGVYGQGVRAARWAALGCDATSRQQSNANSAGVCKPLRQSFHVIQAPSNQGKGFDPKGFRVVLVAVLNRPANYRQRSAKLGIGGFHVSSSVAASGVETFTS